MQADPRDGSHKTFRIRMLRVVKQVKYRSVLHYFPRVHHIDIVADLRNYPEIVRNDQDAHTLFRTELLHQAKDLRLDRDIQSRRGLIRNQKTGRTDHGHSDHYPLTQASGQFMRITGKSSLRLRDTDFFKHFNGLLFCFLLRGSLFVNEQGFLYLMSRAKHRVQGRQRFLEDHGNILSAYRPQLFFTKPDQLPVPEPYRSALNAAGIPEQTHHGSRRHALTAAGFTDKTHDLSVRDRQIHTVHGPDNAFIRKKRCMQVTDLQYILTTHRPLHSPITTLPPQPVCI